jgi:hypothetical protein
MVRKPLADREGIWTELQTANDRAAVILAATFVEEAILEAIIDSLKIEGADALEELIGNNAPLGTFSQQDHDRSLRRHNRRKSATRFERH